MKETGSKILDAKHIYSQRSLEVKNNHDNLVVSAKSCRIGKPNLSSAHDATAMFWSAEMAGTCFRLHCQNDQCTQKPDGNFSPSERAIERMLPILIPS